VNAFFFAIVATHFVALAQSNWPQFRGADSRGTSDNQNLPDHWSATENVAWKCELPGRGWSSPIVWGQNVFVTTVINSGESEAPKKGLYFGGDRPKPPESVHQWKVYCLDLSTGKTRWERQVHEGKPRTSIHLKSSYASETPVTDGHRVYCYFGNLGVFCFDFEGKEIWRRNLEPNETRFGWGTAASPVLHQDRLYLVNDNEKDSYLLALDTATGNELWRTSRDEKSNWSTPFIWTNSQRTEIVTPGTGKIRSYDLDGQLLWSLAGMSSITIATPYEHNGLLYVSSGYVMDAKRPIYAIRPGATGDISLTGQQTSSEYIAWAQPKAAPYNPTTLVYNDRLHVLYDRGILSCYRPSDGAEIYGPQRLPNGGAFTCSPWAYDGKIFCQNEDGVTYVIRADDKLDVLHSNNLAEDDMCMATPAISGDRLLIRTAARIYCIQNAKPPAGKPTSQTYSTNATNKPSPAEGDLAEDDLGRHGYANSGNVRIHYVSKGTGPLVVMIHGFPDYWYTWRKQIPAIARDFQVVAIDQRGYNFSDQPVGVENYSMAKLVEDVRTVIRHFQREQATIIGHDWGGMVAWQFAMSYPKMTERLVVLNLPHPNGLMRELANNPEQQKNIAYARFFQTEGAASQLKPEKLVEWVADPIARTRYVDAMRRSSLEGMLNYYKANYPREPYTIRENLGPNVQCSVLLIHGLKDKALLSSALNDTWKWIDKDLTLVTVPESDHFVQQDAAETVTNTIVRWLNR
jgi:pimeloyl-ACP methyl ester carboxylesterase